MEKSNPVVFISGATAGIGEATARLFAQNGYDLIITGRRADRLETFKTELINNTNVKVIGLCFDVRNQSDVIENIGIDRAMNILGRSFYKILLID